MDLMHKFLLVHIKSCVLCDSWVSESKPLLYQSIIFLIFRAFLLEESTWVFMFTRETAFCPLCGWGVELLTHKGLTQMDGCFEAHHQWTDTPAVQEFLLAASLCHICTVCEQELGSSTWTEMLFRVIVRIVFNWEVPHCYSGVFLLCSPPPSTLCPLEQQWSQRLEDSWNLRKWCHLALI